MKRRIIEIDRQKCNGCGLCANACHEGAIGIVDGKAQLLRDDYCDGLGDCLPACPMNAISFVEREAAAYDEAAVKAHLQKRAEKPQIKMLRRSQLQNWPVQIKLAPMQAEYYEGAELLIAADCTAFAYAAFHEDFIHGKVVLVGCPKLDGIDYAMKLMRILQYNDVQSVTVVRMEVPCCGGLEFAAKRATEESGKALPLKVVTIRTDGSIKE